MDVIREGTPGDALFILYKGEVVVKTLAQGRVKILHASENDFPYFGEQALVKDDLRNATITVESDCAEILSIDRDTFEQLLGPLKYSHLKSRMVEMIFFRVVTVPSKLHRS